MGFKEIHRCVIIWDVNEKAKLQTKAFNRRLRYTCKSDYKGMINGFFLDQIDMTTSVLLIWDSVLPSGSHFKVHIGKILLCQRSC